MTVKEFKQHANAKVQVLIPSVDVYDVYHSRTQECYLYAGDAATCDDKVIDFFEKRIRSEYNLRLYKITKDPSLTRTSFLARCSVGSTTDFKSVRRRFEPCSSHGKKIA